MASKTPFVFTEDVRQRYLILVARTGQVTTPAHMVGVTRQTIHNTRESDPAFDEAVNEALDRYRD
ncbi:MAG TPA: hypothetical protein VFV84_09195, partial [Burkholderiales bacterium]|nr:hypothetical protein [Burkholderiales bacterium]